MNPIICFKADDGSIFENESMCIDRNKWLKVNKLYVKYMKEHVDTADIIMRMYKELKSIMESDNG